MSHFLAHFSGRLMALAILLAPASPVTAQPGSADPTPWPADVLDHRMPEPGEHPRLFFRESDLPEIRRRATETPEGRAMVAQLRRLLGNNGESLPDHWNDRFPVNIGAGGNEALPVGAFTIAHPAGYGMLYQLTGEKKYADLARQALERMFDDDLYQVKATTIKRQRGKNWRPKGDRFENADLSDVVITYGQPDRDERYTWTRPGAKLRLGALMLNVALAYDLCYDGWEEPFRRRVAREIVEYDKPTVDYDRYAEGHKGRATMDVLVNCPFPPTSNHFGAYIGGAGVALLAVRGDPGVDTEQVDAWLATIEKQTRRALTDGFGDHGFFAEGHGPSHMAANTAFVPYLQAARVAWGKDFIAPRPNAPWLTLRWAMEVIPAEKPWYPNFVPGAYGPGYVARGGMSDGGEWAQGFGALANEDQKAAMLWMYRHAMETHRPMKKYDAWLYPHRAVLALINWPIGTEPLNPGEVIGHVNVDRTMGHYMFRKQWRDQNDVYFTFLLNPDNRRGYVKGPRGGNMAFYAHGLRVLWRHPPRPENPRRQTHLKTWEDGSGSLAFVSGEDKQVSAILVDYTEASGVAGVVVFANPWFDKARRTAENWKAMRSARAKDGSAGITFVDVQVGDTPFLVAMMHAGEDPPQPTARDGGLVLGDQTYHLDDGKLYMKTVPDDG